MASKPVRKALLDHRAIWRWHFYAGLFCAPFVLALAITGAIYLFKPQVEAMLDRPYDRLVLSGTPASADAVVTAALAAVPGGQLKALEVRPDPSDAARVLVAARGGEVRVYVHPTSLQVLKTVREKDRFMEQDKEIHHALLMGPAGAILVELAASWAIVMIVTGLYLWWPRGAQGLAGVLYPRLRGGSRLFWRDLHAVTGVWVSSFALFMLLTGLPWTTVWGAGFKAAREATGLAVAVQDWPGGLPAKTAPAAMDGMAGMDMSGMDMSGMEMGPAPAAPLDAMVATARAERLAPPVLLSPPKKPGGAWTVRSDSQNRPLRATLTLDPTTGAVTKREGFETRHVIDRVVAYGVAAHEGQLFGWVNQLLGLLTALGVATLAVSGMVMWWRRRPDGALGAPAALSDRRLASGLGLLILGFAVFLPVLGVSLVAVALVERLLLGRIAPVRAWLGLRAA